MQVNNDVTVIKQERDMQKENEYVHRMTKGETVFPYTHGDFVELRQKKLAEERKNEFHQYD